MPGYEVTPDELHAHRWRVTLTLPAPLARQELALPAWVPGSYTLRHFSRHLGGLRAWQGRQERPVEQLDHSRWQVACCGRAALRVSWVVHARDPSVRGAWLDAARGFFTGASLLLRAVGHEAQPHRLRLGALPRGWQVATAMAPAGPRQWQAGDYAELIDHPFLLGPMWRGRMQVRGVPHELVVQGAWPGFDGERLLADLQRLCEAHVALWHGPRGVPPFERYLFQLRAADEGFGGLEHRASCALLAPRRDLPRREGAVSEGYAELLSLCSHEYFHAWNAKRLQPAGLAAPDLQRANPSPLLWWFEGVTSYYDDLLLCRAGLLPAPRWLRQVARHASDLLATPGRHRHSLAQASYDAWTKYYHPDDNTPNATVSYYTKGALVALALDALLRTGPRRGATLDAVLRHLWERHADTGPINADHIAAALRAVGGRSFEPELAAWVHGTAELPLAELLAPLGVQLTHEPASLAQRLGLRLAESALTGVQVRHVLAGSAAQRAGLAAGDELLAVNGWRLRRLEDAQAWLLPGEPLALLLARDQQVLTRVLPAGVKPAAPGPVALALQPRPTPAAHRRRRAWLGA